MWYNLRIEGACEAVTGTTGVYLLMSDPDLTRLLDRLSNRLEWEVDGTVGEMPGGLLAALTVQLQLSQWRRPEDSRRFADRQGRVFPWMGKPRNDVPGCGSS